MSIGKHLRNLSTPQWLAALVIPPIASFTSTLLLYYTGWPTSAEMTLGNIRQAPDKWFMGWLPASLMIAFLGYLIPQRRSVINWIFYFAIALIVYGYYFGIES